MFRFITQPVVTAAQETKRTAVNAAKTIRSALDRGMVAGALLPAALRIALKPAVALTAAGRKQAAKAAALWLVLAATVGADAAYFLAERQWIIGMELLAIALTAALLAIWMLVLMSGRERRGA